MMTERLVNQVTGKKENGVTISEVQNYLSETS